MISQIDASNASRFQFGDEDSPAVIAGGKHGPPAVRRDGDFSAQTSADISEGITHEEITGRLVEEIQAAFRLGVPLSRQGATVDHQDPGLPT